MDIGMPTWLTGSGPQGLPIIGRRIVKEETAPPDTLKGLIREALRGLTTPQEVGAIVELILIHRPGDKRVDVRSVCTAVVDMADLERSGRFGHYAYRLNATTGENHGN